jgi:hypothetical protein
MAPSIEDATMRKLTQIVALVPPVVAYLLLKPPSFADQTLVQLSTSQWVAILTAVPAAVTYAVYFKAAEAHPESALAVNLDEFYRLHPEAAQAGSVDPEQPEARVVKENDGAERGAPVAAPSPATAGQADADTDHSKDHALSDKEPA